MAPSFLCLKIRNWSNCLVVYRCVYQFIFHLWSINTEYFISRWPFEYTYAHVCLNCSSFSGAWGTKRKIYLFYLCNVCNMSRILMFYHIYLHIFQICYNLNTESGDNSFAWDSTLLDVDIKQSSNRQTDIF